MVLESILFPFKAEKSPWKMFFVGLLFTSVAIFLSLWLFEEKASFIMVFFIVIASVPIVYNTLKYEESKDMHLSSEKRIALQHNRAVYVLSFLFLGMVVASVFWYLVLPMQEVGYIFEQQISTISQINNAPSGSVTGFATSTDILFRIFFNNLKVLIFCILFAFIYGAGSIFILTWNATVIAAAMGNFIRSNIASMGFISTIFIGFLRYAIHGIPEVVAYFYGGITGGIISVAIIKNHFATDKASTILLDVGELFLIAIGFLIIGSIFEVFLTPALF